MYIKMDYRTLREFATTDNRAYRLVVRNQNQNPTYAVLYREENSGWEVLHLGSRKHCVERFNEYMRFSDSVRSFQQFQDM